MVLDLLNHGSFSETEVLKLASKVEFRKSLDAEFGLWVPAECVAECAGLHKPVNCDVVKDQLTTDHIISSVSIVEQSGKPSVVINLNRGMFMKQILDSQVSAYDSHQKRVVVEFSSPNIAKPIHVGHLRSTIIGNFIANLHEWFGYDVKRLNYLGDWGPQFGLVKIGMKMLNPTQEELSSKPLYTLYQAYVTANAAVEKDPHVYEEAKKLFLNLERGALDDVSDWKLYKKYTVEELMKTYSRLGIKFDNYSWESDYNANSIGHILELLKSSGHLVHDEEGRSVVNVAGKAVPILKSDGTTLYLTRDIASAIDRKDKYKFDMMYYLADTSQHKHFKNLFSILSGLDFAWSENLRHIRFGRVRGMSTRRGEAILLNDILDEAYHLMIQQQKASPNTRVNLQEDLKTADVLGVSTIIVADLIHKRRKDYTFDWDSARSMTKNTGVRLQYTHCRLKSLQEKNNLPTTPECDPSSLTEPEALALLFEISRFDDVLNRSFNELEASKLSEYLFTLCDSINKAMLTLRVSGTGKVGEQRLLLFSKAAVVLHCGMRLMGLTPLDRM
ncbi:hypothetical protein ONE63_010761 [Megalurothrips usitatus]|uniref:Probable arginine--tRNA ligase, mitochondrial n=1 Tax=Megalurothrips usitatus TaxID=439358 RepID=A0AAV7XIB6_9NEOP|nr:hypothetical protein ONE63_010761 [Megalurothrips usitatus]